MNCYFNKKCYEYIYKIIKCVCIIKLILVNYNNNVNDFLYFGYVKYIVMEYNFFNLEKKIFLMI